MHIKPQAMRFAAKQWFIPFLDSEEIQKSAARLSWATINLRLSDPEDISKFYSLANFQLNRGKQAEAGIDRPLGFR
jgi:hypothetical protein